MFDDLGYMLGGVGDRFKNGIGVMGSDPGRLAMIGVFSVVVFAVIVGSAYTINLSGAALGKSVTIACTTNDPVVLPLLTNPLNTTAVFSSIQCTVGNGDILTLVFYFLEVFVVIFVGVYICIVILNLSG